MELAVAAFALGKGLIHVVQAAMLGAILNNLLLVSTLIPPFFFFFFFFLKTQKPNSVYIFTICR